MMDSRTTIQVEESLRKELKVLAARRDLSYQDLLGDMISLFKELDRKKTVISIPKGLVEKVEEKIQKTDFSTVSEFVTYLLRQLLADTYMEIEITKKDEENIKKKLKVLGYI